MDYSEHEPIPAELEQVATRLRTERATATALEFDRIKLRAIQQAARPRAGMYIRQKGKLMKSRLALTMVIATGMLMSTGGATLALSGSSGSGSASQSQYGQVHDPKGGTTLGASGGDVAPTTDQVSVANTDSGSLPFTGFAAIPLLILGIGFLTVGVVLRVKLNRQS